MKTIKEFLTYVIPAVAAFALAGVYTIADGFFLGNSVGDVGLSAINIAYPVVTMMQAIGTGIGMGGAVLYTIALSSGRKREAKEYGSSSLLWLIISSILFTVLMSVFMSPILKFLGAEGENYIFGEVYLRIMIFGSVFQIVSLGMTPLIRNYGGAVYSTIMMTVGFLVNIILDYILIWIFDYGVAGAAFGSILGQAASMLLGAIFLIRKKISIERIAPARMWTILLKIIKIGIAPFGLTLSPILSLILMNRYSVKIGGSDAVACYACISYAVTIVYLLLQGVGDGSQPLMSRFYGEGNEKELSKIKWLALLTAGMIGLLSMLFLFYFRNDTGSLFGASEKVNEMVGLAMPIFVAGFVFLAVTRVITSYFYATEKNMRSYMLVYAEPIILWLLLIAATPYFKQQGVWWSMCLAQVLSAVLAVLLLAFNKKSIEVR